MKVKLTTVGCLAVLLLSAGTAAAQDVNVTARVSLTGAAHMHSPKPQDVVLWLTPADGSVQPIAFSKQPLRLVQKNKSFHPHVLVVPVGALVAFPNHDPFFHNVFSLFEGKRFDLGLYEAGSTRDVRFDKPGVSYIFCNIHPEMSAVIVALNTPYYGISDQQGQVLIPNVPSGRYALHVWYEAALPDALPGLTREVTISPQSPSLGSLRLIAARLPQPHKNKYGHDYEPPQPQTPAYDRP